MDSKAKKIFAKSVVSALFLGYIAFASVSNLWFPPGFKFQLPELLFLLILPVAFYLRKRIYLSRLDYLFFGYVFLFGINFVFHPERPVFTEFVGTFYLFSVYFLLSRFLADLNEKEAHEFLSKAFFAMLTVACISAILSGLIYWFGWSKHYIVEYENYPYFGDVVRVKGFSSSPNMLLSNICIALFFIQISSLNPLKNKVSDTFEVSDTYIRPFWKQFSIFFGISIALLTLSKELAAFFVLFGLLTLANAKAKFPRKSQNVKDFKNLSHLIRANPKRIALFGIPLILLLIGLSFFVFVPTSPDSKNIYKNKTVIGTEPVFKTQNFDVFPTAYFYLFEGAKALIKENPVTGVGSGNFQKELDRRKTEGKYPVKMPTFEPHDIYWGQIAELGLGHLIFLIFVFWGFIRFLTNKDDIFPPNYHLFLTVGLVFVFVESAVSGTKHFRHYWIFFAVLNSFYLRRKILQF